MVPPAVGRHTGRRRQKRRRRYNVSVGVRRRGRTRDGNHLSLTFVAIVSVSPVPDCGLCYYLPRCLRNPLGYSLPMECLPAPLATLCFALAFSSSPLPLAILCCTFAFSPPPAASLVTYSDREMYVRDWSGVSLLSGAIAHGYCLFTLSCGH